MPGGALHNLTLRSSCRYSQMDQGHFAGRDVFPVVLIHHPKPAVHGAAWIASVNLIATRVPVPGANHRLCVNAQQQDAAMETARPAHQCLVELKNWQGD
jgi:hypothetical protein